MGHLIFAVYVCLISFFRQNGSEIYLHDPKSLFTFVINQSDRIEKRSEFSIIILWKMQEEDLKLGCPLKYYIAQREYIKLYVIRTTYYWQRGNHRYTKTKIGNCFGIMVTKSICKEDFEMHKHTRMRINMMLMTGSEI